MPVKNFNHVPVLLNEVLNGLNINPNGIYIDGTIRRSRTQLPNSKKDITIRASFGNGSR